MLFMKILLSSCDVVFSEVAVMIRQIRLNSSGDFVIDNNSKQYRARELKFGS